MDFSLTDDQKQICGLMEELSVRYLNDGVYADDERAVFRRDKWARIADTGLLGLPFPEDYGGPLKEC